jgi:hypothetical protein
MALQKQNFLSLKVNTEGKLKAIPILGFIASQFQEAPKGETK